MLLAPERERVEYVEINATFVYYLDKCCPFHVNPYAFEGKRKSCYDTQA